jgi:hypothetical protein
MSGSRECRQSSNRSQGLCLTRIPFCGPLSVSILTVLLFLGVSLCTETQQYVLLTRTLTQGWALGTSSLWHPSFFQSPASGSRAGGAGVWKSLVALPLNTLRHYYNIRPRLKGTSTSYSPIGQYYPSNKRTVPLFPIPISTSYVCTSHLISTGPNLSRAVINRFWNKEWGSSSSTYTNRVQAYIVKLQKRMRSTTFCGIRGSSVL